MTAPDEFVLAIDLGTSGPKTALVSADGRLTGQAFEPVELILLPGGGAEQDPDAWWGAICRAVEKTLALASVDPDAVKAVGCTAQWSGTVCVDAKGQALGNAIIWMDSRGAPHVHRLTGGPIRVAGYSPRKALKWLRRTGGAPGHSGKDPIAHILWVKHEDPERFAATATFLEPKDYLNLRLTGETAASIDSIALYWLTDNRDLTRVDYDPTLLAWAGIPADKLPPLKRAVDVLGPLTAQAAADLGVPAGIPVVTGTPDLQSAALGSGATADFATHLYIGTSSWLTCHVPFKKTDIVHNMASLPSAIPERYFVANEQEVAGKAVDFLLDTILFADDGLGTGARPADVYDRLEKLVASAPPGSGKLVFTPWLYGERTPVEDSTVRGGFFNLSLTATRADLARAVFEGVAYNNRWLLETLERFIKRQVTDIAMIGGGANSPTWCQIMADVLDRPVRQIADPLGANLRGVGLLAGVALGWLGFEQFAERVEVARTFEPDGGNRAAYDELFTTYRLLYRRHRPLCARLNRQA